jgi:RHS repeat-associated protein
VWTWDLKSEAFGNSVPAQDPDGDTTPLVFDMRLPGQRYDAASGLNYNYFRDYDTSTGRYVTSDPIGLSGGATTYSYASDDPFLHFDPDGLRQVNLFNPKISEQDKILFEMANKYWDQSGACLVYAHGGPNVVVDGRGKKSVRITSGKALEKLLLAEGCKPNQPVILYSCNTGKGNNSIAEQLSKTKSFPDVQAPNRQIWYNRPWFWSSGPDKVYGKMPDGKTINPNDPGTMVEY